MKAQWNSTWGGARLLGKHSRHKATYCMADQTTNRAPQASDKSPRLSERKCRELFVQGVEVNCAQAPASKLLFQHLGSNLLWERRWQMLDWLEPVSWVRFDRPSERWHLAPETNCVQAYACIHTSVCITISVHEHMFVHAIAQMLPIYCLAVIYALFSCFVALWKHKQVLTTPPTGA